MFRKKGPQKKSILCRENFRKSLIPQADKESAITFSPIGYYDDKTDLNVLHKYVEKNLLDRRKEKDELDDKIREIKRDLNNPYLKIVDKKLLLKRLEAVQHDKDEIESNEKYKEYLDRSTPILDEWIHVCQEEGTSIRFGQENKFSPDKLSLVRNFIQIASEYVPLNLNVRYEKQNGICAYCREKLYDEEDKIICFVCNRYQDALTCEVTYDDIDRINSYTNNNYVNRETFIKTMTNYQGKEKAEFTSDMFTHIDEYCLFNRINKQDLTPNITIPIFKSTGYSNYYNHVNLFLSMYIGRKLPDISQYESVLLQDYDQFSQKYQEIKDDDRDSSLNAQYVLYILLRRRKIACNIVDFKIPETPNIRIAIDSVARKVFTDLGWNFEDTS